MSEIQTTRHQCRCRDCSPGTCGMDGGPHCVNCIIDCRPPTQRDIDRTAELIREFGRPDGV